MNWEDVKDRPIGATWERAELAECFAAVAGGVAYQGKRPGFAVVAGLRPVQRKDVYEIHVLDEAESTDMGELLRQCRSLILKYPTGRTSDDGFRWYGDGRNMAAQALVREINDAARAADPNDRRVNDLSITSVLQVLEMQEPYAYCLAKLREYTASDRKQLFLRGSRVQHSMQEIQPDEVFELAFGSHPAVEAIAFVVVGLRGQAESIIQANELGGRDTSPYRNWPRFNRGGRR